MTAKKSFEFVVSEDSPFTTFELRILKDGSLDLDVGGEYGGKMDAASAARLAMAIVMAEETEFGPAQLGRRLDEILALLRGREAAFEWPEGGRRYVLGASWEAAIPPGGTVHLRARSELLTPVRVLGVIPVGNPGLLLRDIRIGQLSVFGNSNPVVFGSLEPLGGVYPIEGPELHPTQELSCEVTNTTGSLSMARASILCWGKR